MKRPREPEEAPPTEAAPTAQNLGVKGDGVPKETSSGEGDASPPAAKITELDLSDNDNSSEVAIHCSLPPHKTPLVFSSYSAYETHHRDQHTNRCAECRKNFPSAHLLGVHIEEMHDSFVQAQRERGDRTVSFKECSILKTLASHLTVRLSTRASWRDATENTKRLRSGRCTWSTSTCTPRTSSSPLRGTASMAGGLCSKRAVAAAVGHRVSLLLRARALRKVKIRNPSSGTKRSRQRMPAQQQTRARKAPSRSQTRRWRICPAPCRRCSLCP